MGPLKGIRIVEMAGIGPGPFCAMMLADAGAEIIRIDRKQSVSRGMDLAMPDKWGVANRGRRSVALDLKKPEAVEAVLKLAANADGLLEGFRPGVMERLGLGPDICLERNPRLIYGRMTGWGQDGPLAHAAGHDLNYIALSGALHAIGRPGETPVPPLNLVGDYGGGAMMLAYGMVCALLEAARSGHGQVVDAAMTDGAAVLMAMMYGLKAGGLWSDRRGNNFIDGGAHFYDTYECKDGGWVSIGSIEPQFYALLLELCEIDDPEFQQQMNRKKWPELKQRLAEVFKSRTRDEWCELLEGTDVCFAPVLDMNQAPRHPHNEARKAFIEIAGVVQPAPAPRFSRTESEVQGPPPSPGEHTEEALSDWGFSSAEIDTLWRSEAI